MDDVARSLSSLLQAMPDNRVDVYVEK